MHRQTKNDGAIAQMVEQRTENPCVPGSIPGGTTNKKGCRLMICQPFLFYRHYFEEGGEQLKHKKYSCQNIQHSDSQVL